MIAGKEWFEDPQDLVNLAMLLEQQQAQIASLSTNLDTGQVFQCSQKLKVDDQQKSQIISTSDESNQKDETKIKYKGKVNKLLLSRKHNKGKKIQKRKVITRQLANNVIKHPLVIKRQNLRQQIKRFRRSLLKQKQKTQKKLKHESQINYSLKDLLNLIRVIEQKTSLSFTFNFLRQLVFEEDKSNNPDGSYNAYHLLRYTKKWLEDK